MGETRPMTAREEAVRTEEVKATLAAVRARMVAALEGDSQALHVIARAFPADWEDANLGAVWLLGNAARFGHPYAQVWLDRLVHPDGEPKADSDISFGDRDRALLREIGALLDRLDAALGDDDAISNLLTSARLSYLGGYCAGLADRSF